MRISDWSSDVCSSDLRAQRILKIDDLDHHGSITFEHMAAVDVRRRPKPDQRLKHRETRHLPIARQRGDIFENLAIADIGRFVCVDPQQFSSGLSHYASPLKGAVSSPCGVLPS